MANFLEADVADLSSFDIVSKVDMQEVKNAVDQALKEIRQRYDFKGSKAGLDLNEKESTLTVVADDDYKLKAVLDILKTKCVKRGVSLKALVHGKVEEAQGGTVRQVITIQSGLTSEKAKEISKEIRDAKLKVQAQIQGDQVRVQCKSKNELQATIAHLRTKDFGVDLQFCNYR